MTFIKNAAAILGSATLCVASLSVPARVASAQAVGEGAVSVRVNDARGRNIGVQRLTPADRARVERLRAAMAGVAGAEPAARTRVTITCSYPPLRCTIVITFGLAQR